MDGGQANPTLTERPLWPTTSAPRMAKVNAEFPPAFRPFFGKARYKVVYGGRGGAKSWAISRALLIKGVQEPLRILCTRELQSSIKDSVHRLLKDQIEAMGLTEFYEILDKEIRGKNGTLFVFEGLRYNANKIKSFEGFDIAWVEEAHSVTEENWEVLSPTIRKPGSEIWISFNPHLKSDVTYQKFVLSPPPNAVVIKMNWQDNPWFPEVLHDEMEDMKRKDFEAYLNVWEGHPRTNLAGAVYGEELKLARVEKRICKVNYDPLVPVDTFWDLGWLDATAIWFGQKVGSEYHIIRYVSGTQRDIPSYLRELASYSYNYGTYWLPHDAKAKELGTGRSIEELMRAAGKTVRIVPKLRVEDGINAARTIFPLCYFDEQECGQGIESLSSYVKDKNGSPVHDWASHGADGFRYLAVALKAPKKGGLSMLRKIEISRQRIFTSDRSESGKGWMK